MPVTLSRMTIRRMTEMRLSHRTRPGLPSSRHQQRIEYLLQDALQLFTATRD